MIKQRAAFVVRAFGLIATLWIAPQTAMSQEHPSAPLQLTVSGSHRTRYENLWNQIQPDAAGNDAALSLRTTLFAEFRSGPVAAGIELADSRVYLADDNTPLGTSHVNPIDVLQAYVTTSVPNIVTEGSDLWIKLGRQTMDVGSRRFVARNRFRNTINSRTGIDLEWTALDQSHLRGFVTVPVQRRVQSITVNSPQLDIERTESVFWGVLLGSRTWNNGIRAELEVFGIHERDSEDYQTNNRNFITSGGRVYRSPVPALIDFEFESVVQVGTSRRTSQPDDLTDLEHRAYFAHLAIGYTLPSVWNPRLILQYDHATGDKDPADDSNDRFDTLYGARRFEYGPTGIYGAFARSNVTSPGFRIELAPRKEIRGFVGYRALWLAQARDAWTTTAIRDVAGLSGRFLGHQLEGRARFQLLPGNLTLETGFAFLSVGGFAKNAPNGDPALSNPTYLYTQLTLQI